MPNLNGVEFKQVKRKLNNNSLNLGAFHLSNSLLDTMSIIVYKQNPAANQKVDIGSFISVWGKDSIINQIK